MVGAVNGDGSDEQRRGAGTGGGRDEGAVTGESDRRNEGGDGDVGGAGDEDRAAGQSSGRVDVGGAVGSNGDAGGDGGGIVDGSLQRGQDQVAASPDVDAIDSEAGDGDRVDADHGRRERAVIGGRRADRDRSDFRVGAGRDNRFDDVDRAAGGSIGGGRIAAASVAIDGAGDQRSGLRGGLIGRNCQGAGEQIGGGAGSDIDDRNKGREGACGERGDRAVGIIGGGGQGVVDDQVGAALDGDRGRGGSDVAGAEAAADAGDDLRGVVDGGVVGDEVHRSTQAVAAIHGDGADDQRRGAGVGQGASIGSRYHDRAVVDRSRGERGDGGIGAAVDPDSAADDVGAEAADAAVGGDGGGDGAGGLHGGLGCRHDQIAAQKIGAIGGDGGERDVIAGDDRRRRQAAVIGVCRGGGHRGDFLVAGADDEYRAGGCGAADGVDISGQGGVTVADAGGDEQGVGGGAVARRQGQGAAGQGIGGGASGDINCADVVGQGGAAGRDDHRTVGVDGRGGQRGDRGIGAGCDEVGTPGHAGLRVEIGRGVTIADVGGDQRGDGDSRSARRDVERTGQGIGTVGDHRADNQRRVARGGRRCGDGAEVGAGGADAQRQHGDVGGTGGGDHATTGAGGKSVADAGGNGGGGGRGAGAGRQD